MHVVPQEKIVGSELDAHLQPSTVRFPSFVSKGMRYTLLSHLTDSTESHLPSPITPGAHLQACEKHQCAGELENKKDISDYGCPQRWNTDIISRRTEERIPSKGQSSYLPV